MSECVGIQLCCENYGKIQAATKKPSINPEDLEISFIDYDNVACGTRNNEGVLFTVRDNFDVAQFGNLNDFKSNL